MTAVWWGTGDLVTMDAGHVIVLGIVIPLQETVLTSKFWKHLTLGCPHLFFKSFLDDIPLLLLLNGFHVYDLYFRGSSLEIEKKTLFRSN